MNRELHDRARAKLTEESEKIGGPLAQFIEEHIMMNCMKTDAAAEKILEETKTLKGLIKKIENRAKENKTGNVGCVSDEDVRGLAEEYYGITAEDKKDGRPGRRDASAEMIDIMDLL